MQRRPPYTVVLGLILTPLFVHLSSGDGHARKGAQRPEAGSRAQLQLAADGGVQARRAAQRGLDFLAHETVAWQAKHRCYGCHVQAVTLEAMSVGARHQYDVSRPALDAVVKGMLTLPGGARLGTGFSHHVTNLLAPSRAFGGSAFARYDQDAVDRLKRPTQVKEELLQVARQLMAFQRPDGSINLTYGNMPVSTGDIQGTYQATRTWRQAYARTADETWLHPLRQAERYLSARARRVAAGEAGALVGAHQLQEVNYMLLGLSASGVGTSEPMVRALVEKLQAAQNADGGWSYALQPASASNALATGQSLYTLRQLGHTDHDSHVARGIAWLVGRQGQDGGWSHLGSGKAEAMWAVLGLVSTDVVTVAVQGLHDGQHVEGTLDLKVKAMDNGGTSGKGTTPRGVTSLEVLVDDNPIHKGQGAELQHRWDTRSLTTGKHVVDVVARSARGETTHRRFEVYAGPVYLTELATRSSDQGTLITGRDIAPARLAHQVEVQILAAEAAGPGATRPGKVVARLDRPGKSGALDLHWNGKGLDGKPVASGKYYARVTLVPAAAAGARAAALQTEDLLFVRDTVEAQAKSYGRVQGNLRLAAGSSAAAPAAAAPAANAEVELLNDKGQVVQTTRTTGSGQYRFGNVDEGRYHVRVKKAGFKAVSAPVRARRASGADASFDLAR